MNTRSFHNQIFFLLAVLALSQIFCDLSVFGLSFRGDQESINIAIAQTAAARSTQTAASAPTIQPSTQAATIQPPPTKAQPTVQITATSEMPVVSQASTLPETVSISVSLDTNCRKGPSVEYTRVGFLLPGQTVPVFGRNQAGTWWYIENPRKPGEYCWLWGEYATIEGDLSAIPLVTAAPLIACGSETYGFSLNPGSWSCDDTTPNVVKLTKGPYYMVICYEGTSESHICRTGVPAGDWAAGGFAPFLDINLRKDLLYYEGKLKVVNYGGGPVVVDGMRLQIWLDSTYSDYAAVDLPLTTLVEAEAILASFEWIE